MRKVGSALALAAVVAASITTPALADPTPADRWRTTVLPRPGADTDGDGFVTAEVDVALPGSGRSTPVSLPGAPHQIVVEGLREGQVLGVRSRHADTWTPWTEVTATAEEAPDGARDHEPGVGPIWLGDGAEAVELTLLAGDRTDVTLVGLHEEGVTGAATATRAGGFVRPRADWATGTMDWACTSPPKSATVDAAVVHHTAGTNTYTRDQVPEVIRGIWRYHVESRGWCDVAYNFLVDRYGGVWEGRQGGIDRGIVGGHTYGFNTGTVGIAQLGNFHAAEPTSAVTGATRRLLGWVLGLHGLDPLGRTTVVNRTGSEFRGIPDDGDVPVSTIVGHRDLGSTSCPGDHTHEELPGLRTSTRDLVHVFALHERFLQAVPGPASYARWAEVLDADGLGATALAMARSEAYSGLIVDDLYDRVLGRAPDDAGRAYWLDLLDGGMRVEDVGVLFYGSEEFFRASGGVEAYVTALYEHLLHRVPDARGLAYWSGRLTGGTALPPDIAAGFYRSLESRRDRVARLYDTILGRPPDPSGHAHWAEQLLETDDVLLAVDLSLSDEFYERATG